MPGDIPDWVKEAEEALARGETIDTSNAEVTIKFGKGLVGEPFTSKSGKELVEILIPNPDKTDNRPWGSFVISPKMIHDNKFGKGIWMKLPEDGTTRLSRSVKTGIAGSVSSCSIMVNGSGNVVLGTSYTAEDEDLKNVETDYTKLETELRTTIDNIESDHPGYDEYRYNLAEIGHNPYELASLLTVEFEDYTREEVQARLQSIFAAQAGGGGRNPHQDGAFPFDGCGRQCLRRQL